MDSVYITSHAGRPLTSDSAASSTTAAAGHRRFRLAVHLQGPRGERAAFDVTLVDPFVDDDYRTVFEHYLRNTDRPPWSPGSLSTGAGGAGEVEEADEVARAERQIYGYAHALLSQLRLPVDKLQKTPADLQIYVIEHHDSDRGSSLGSDVPGVHCLAWELLESIRLPALPSLRLRVNRVADFPTRTSMPQINGGLATPPPGKDTQTLREAQADPAATIRVLLVVARDFSRTGPERDAEPDLAQYPLMTLQRRLRSRMLLEVVRPGSLEGLAAHLQTRSAQGVVFHVVHFDLHGQILPDEYGTPTPWLLFTKRTYATQRNGYHLPQTRLARAADVAALLAEHHVEAVVLNACLSAYNRTTSLTNLSHTFLRLGIHNISAMWFYVHSQTVSTYLDAFYNQLLRKGVDFHLAAQHGREAVRLLPTVRAGRARKDDFICVNYARRAHRTNSMPREPSPAPSKDSQGSSSGGSGRSFLSGDRWRPSTPRLGDSLIIGDEPVVRMKLHLLELEYKLATFRVVYASDLRRDGSDLADTVGRMASMWMATNMIEEVYYYQARDFARPKGFTNNSNWAPPYREKKSRASSGGYLQLLFPKPVRALKSALHVIRDVDNVVEPGAHPDAATNAKNEERRVRAQEGLQRFARRLHTEADGYCLFLGSKDAQWFRRYLQHLHGAWWLHVPWALDVPSRSPIQRGRARRDGGIDSTLEMGRAPLGAGSGAMARGGSSPMVRGSSPMVGGSSAMVRGGSSPGQAGQAWRQTSVDSPFLPRVVVPESPGPRERRNDSIDSTLDLNSHASR